MHERQLPVTVTEPKSSDRCRESGDLHRESVCLGCDSTKYMQVALLHFDSKMQGAVLDR